MKSRIDVSLVTLGQKSNSFENTPDCKAPISPEGNISLFSFQVQRKNPKWSKETRKL
jgi:hypothetical protein